MHTFPARVLLALVGLAQADRSWHDVELGVGQRLDLLRGGLVESEGVLGHGWLEYRDGNLIASETLRALLLLEGHRGARLSRANGTRVVETSAQRGRSFVFELGGGAWGYLQVLSADPRSCQLEWALAPPGRETLERDPPRMEAQATPMGTILTWDDAVVPPAADPDVAGDSDRPEPEDRWGVWRLDVLSPADEPLFLGEVRQPRLVDSAAPRGELVEYRVARVDAVGRPVTGLGARVRAVSVDTPGEWPIHLGTGMRIDLLSGRVGGKRAHVEVVHPGPRTVQLRPVEGTTLSRPVAVAGKEWSLPDPSRSPYEPNLRGIMVGGEIAARLPEGVFVRLRFEGEPGQPARLRRQYDLEGGRVLPREPLPPSVTWRAGRLDMRFTPLDTGESGLDLAGARLLVERERFLGSDDWFVWQELPVDQPRADLDAGPQVELARLRYRYALESGLISLPSEPQRVLLGDPHDEPTLAGLLERAFAGLVSPDWRERTAARSLLFELGPLARERLVAALRSADPEVQSAAREVLLQTGPDPGTAVEAILSARAALEGIAGAAPVGWLAPLANHRAAALLTYRVETEDAVDVAGWQRVLALGDPDPGVRALAELALEQEKHAHSARRLRGQPWAVLPEEERGLRRLPSLAVLLAGGADPVYALRALREGSDPDRPRAALTTLEVAERLELELGRDSEGGADLEACALALRLLDRHRAGGDSVLLAAAEALVSTPAVRLGALERFVRARLDQLPSASLGPALGRERILLAEPDYDTLVRTLESLAARAGKPCDVVLPPGMYRAGASGGALLLDLGISGLRLIAEAPGVHLASGVRIEGAHDVVLDGLTVENEAGPALIGVSSRITLRDCKLRGGDWDANLQSCLLELDGVHVLPDAAEGRGSHSLRLSGESQLFARDSLLEGGGIVLISPEASLYLERCVLDGGEHNAIQAQQSRALVVRDCLLRSQEAALFGAGEALLEGVVAAVEGSFLQNCEGPVRFCPLHLGLTGRALDLGGAEALAECPLER